MNETTAVVIGRFSLNHRGHHRLLRVALAQAGEVVVVLGSAFHARSPKNPFTWEERADAIRLCLAPTDRARVRFTAVRDYYNDDRWAAAVTKAVEDTRSARGPVVLVGHFKDDSSRYLEWFPHWQQCLVEAREPIDATALRLAYFGMSPTPSLLHRVWDFLLRREPASGMESRLAVIGRYVEEPMVGYLRAWAKMPWYRRLVEEQAQLDREHAAWAPAPYSVTFTTVDAVVETDDHVLLVQRGRSPGKGLLALPGGFVNPRERLLMGAMRELEEETQIGLLPDMLERTLKSVRVFDHPDRSLRGRTITHAHHFQLGLTKRPQVTAADDAEDAMWVPKNELAALEDRFFEDHFHILNDFLKIA